MGRDFSYTNKSTKILSSLPRGPVAFLPSRHPAHTGAANTRVALRPADAISRPRSRPSTARSSGRRPWARTRPASSHAARQEPPAARHDVIPDTAPGPAQQPEPATPAGVPSGHVRRRTRVGQRLRSTRGALTALTGHTKMAPNSEKRPFRALMILYAAWDSDPEPAD